MNKLTLYHWWIGLLMLSGPLSLAQHSDNNERILSPPSMTTCHLDCFKDWVQQGNIYFEQQAYSDAIPYFEQALRIKRKEEDPTIIIQCLIDLSLAVAYDQQFERARAHLEEAAWHLRQQPPNLFQLKSNHLITQIRQTVDSLDGVHQGLIAESFTKQVKKNSSFWLTLQQILPYSLFSGFLLFFFIIWVTMRQVGKDRKKEALAYENLKQLLQYVTKQHVYERHKKRELLAQNKRLAAEMQDGLGNLISAVKLQVEQMGDDVADTNPDMAINLQKISSWLEQACVDLRGISQKLLDRQPQQNGQESEIYGMITTWVHYLTLTNQTRAIHIQLNMDEEGLHLSIEDDGSPIIYTPKEAIVMQDLKRRIAAYRW